MSPITKSFKAVLKNLAFLYAPAAIAPLVITLAGYSQVPPLLGGRAVMFIPVAAAAIYLVYRFVRSYRASNRKLIRWALWLLTTSLLLAICHSAFLQQWTVAAPRSDSPRFSIGFGMAEWSLTEYGKALAAQENKTTPDSLMMADAAFHPGGPERLWKAWTIALSSVSLALMFLSSLIAWSAGWGSLASSYDGGGNNADSRRP